MTPITHTTKRSTLTQLTGKIPYANAFLLLGIVTFAVLYIGQVNSAASTGFRMNDLQTNIDNLHIANQQLEYRVAENRAMYTVARRVSILGMVRPDGVSYVSEEPSSVALGNF